MGLTDILNMFATEDVNKVNTETERFTGGREEQPRTDFGQENYQQDQSGREDKGSFGHQTENQRQGDSEYTATSGYGRSTDDKFDFGSSDIPDFKTNETEPRGGSTYSDRPGQGFGRNDDDDRPSGGFYTEQSRPRSDRPSSGGGLGGQQFSGPGGFDSNRPSSSGYGGSGSNDKRRNQGSTKYGSGRQFDRD